MICSIGHGEMNDLNFRLAPSCITPNYTLVNDFSTTPSVFVSFESKISSNIPKIIIPKQAKTDIVIINSNDSIENKKIKLFTVSHSDDNSSESTLNNELNSISDNDITLFNTDTKLKKIHSTYHLKRKVSTKFQNEIKIHVNNLIMECNKSDNELNIPFVNPCSKIFREDVKLKTLSVIKNFTINKFLNEDLQYAGRSINIKNDLIMKLIEKLNEKYANNEKFKKLYNFLFKEVVFDFYNLFLESRDYKNYLEKDLKKYEERLNKLKYPESKIALYKKIFKEKYEGIARNMF